MDSLSWKRQKLDAKAKQVSLMNVVMTTGTTQETLLVHLFLSLIENET